MKRFSSTIWFALCLAVGLVIFSWRLLKTFRQPTITFAERVKICLSR